VSETAAVTETSAVAAKIAMFRQLEYFDGEACSGSDAQNRHRRRRRQKKKQPARPTITKQQPQTINNQKNKQTNKQTKEAYVKTLTCR
jgi:hypothetical protein